MVTKLNPSVITDDMMYEGVIALDDNELKDSMAQIREDRLWGEVRRAAKTNKTLQAALDHAIMIYKLSKEYKDGV
jgi:hypothetical protein